MSNTISRTIVSAAKAYARSYERFAAEGYLGFNSRGC